MASWVLVGVPKAIIKHSIWKRKGQDTVGLHLTARLGENINSIILLFSLVVPTIKAHLTHFS